MRKILLKWFKRIWALKLLNYRIFGTLIQVQIFPVNWLFTSANLPISSSHFILGCLIKNAFIGHTIDKFFSWRSLAISTPWDCHAAMLLILSKVLVIRMALSLMYITRNTSTDMNQTIAKFPTPPKKSSQLSLKEVAAELHGLILRESGLCTTLSAKWTLLDQYQSHNGKTYMYPAWTTTRSPKMFW